jgi:hypothetical protein
MRRRADRLQSFDFGRAIFRKFGGSHSCAKGMATFGDLVGVIVLPTTDEEMFGIATGRIVAPMTDFVIA